MSEAPKKIWVSPLQAQITQDQDKDYQIPYVRGDIVEEMRDKLIIASQVFRAYQAHHEAKGDMSKAERNKEYAWQMEVTLQTLEDE